MSLLLSGVSLFIASLVVMFRVYDGKFNPRHFLPPSLSLPLPLSLSLPLSLTLSLFLSFSFSLSISLSRSLSPSLSLSLSQWPLVAMPQLHSLSLPSTLWFKQVFTLPTARNAESHCSVQNLGSSVTGQLNINEKQIIYQEVASVRCQKALTCKTLEKRNPREFKIDSSSFSNGIWETEPRLLQSQMSSYENKIDHTH